MNKNEKQDTYKDHTDQQLESLLSDNDQGLEIREAVLYETVSRATRAKNVGQITALIESGKKLSGGNKIGLARILKRLLDVVSATDDKSRQVELEICQQILEWTIKENKNFLRYKIQLQLANILYQKGEFKRSKELLDGVLKEARDVDDKHLLIEGHLLESQLIFQTKNWPKAKAALTMARAAANSVYVAPLLQAEIESSAGMIHLAEKDFPIAFSYFYEGFEAFHQNADSDRASRNFNYLLLSKIMLDSVDDAEGLVNGRYGQIYGHYSKTANFMSQVLGAYKQKSLVQLSTILMENKDVVDADKTIKDQVVNLYEQLLEKNISKLITPYSRVELEYLARKLGVTVEKVERKISEMILDEKLRGSIDQDNGVLIIFDEQKKNELFDSSMEILTNVDAAVDMLFQRAEKLNV